MQTTKLVHCEPLAQLLQRLWILLLSYDCDDVCKRDSPDIDRDDIAVSIVGAVGSCVRDELWDNNE